MRGFILFCALLGVVLFSVSLYGSDLLPLAESSLGTSFSDFATLYPEVKLVSVERDSLGIVTHGVAYLGLLSSAFWHAAIIEIKQDSVESFSLVVIHDTKQARDNVKIILSALLERLGDGFDFKVAKLKDRQKDYSAPLLSWTNENKLYSFCFTPISLHDEIEFFNCQLTIMSHPRSLTSFFLMNDVDSTISRALTNEIAAMVNQIRGD